MRKGLFITATGTDVGKTFVTALMLKKMREAGLNAGYYKAALSGAVRLEGGLVPGDAQYVNQTACLGEEPSDLVSYIYEAALSPHLAAKLEGGPVTMEKVRADYQRMLLRHDYVIMEGSGGIVCPIRYDEEETIFLEDIILELGLGALVVADAGLGTINHTALTAAYLKSRGIAVRGIILNRFRPGNLMEEDNRKMIEEITGIQVVSAVAEDASDMDLGAEELSGLF